MRCNPIPQLVLIICTALFPIARTHAADRQQFSYHAGLYAKRGLLLHENKLYALAAGTGFNKAHKIGTYKESPKFYPAEASRIVRYALTDKQQFMLLHPQRDPNDRESHKSYLALTKENEVIVLGDINKSTAWKVEELQDPDYHVPYDSFEGHLVLLSVPSDDPEKRYVALSPEKTVIKAATGQDIVLHQLILGPKAEAAQFEFVTGYSGK